MGGVVRTNGHDGKPLFFGKTNLRKRLARTGVAKMLAAPVSEKPRTHAPMTQEYDLNHPIYQAGQSAMSMANLLAYFVDPNYQRGNLSRISDMHVKIGRPVSFRIDDDLTPVPEGIPVTDEIIRYMLGIILSAKHLEITFSDNPEDVDTGYEWVEGGVNFRLNIFRDRDGLAFVMRVLSSVIPGIETLGLPSEQIWQDITALKRGLVLVTGVTGSGKSTTIAAMINPLCF